MHYGNEGMFEGLLTHEAKPSALLASRPCPMAIFLIVHERKQLKFNKMASEVLVKLEEYTVKSDK